MKNVPTTAALLAHHIRHSPFATRHFFTCIYLCSSAFICGSTLLPLRAADTDLPAFQSQYAALPEKDIDARITLANWALQHELYPQLSQVTRDIFALDPFNKPAYALALQADANLPLPPDPAAEADLKSEMKTRFNRDFSTRTTRHFLIVYDTTDEFSISRGNVLEQAYDAFMFYLNLKTIRPQFLTQRLVVVLFKSRQDYIDYARQIDHADLSWSAGYYTQRNNRSAFFDDATSADSETTEQDLAKLTKDLDTLETQLANAREHAQADVVNELLAERTELRSRLMMLKSRTTKISGIANKSKTLHEAAHQLAFNTGIQTRHVDYPFWLAEGLACNFEIDSIKTGPGPALINTYRLMELRKALNTVSVRLKPAERDALLLDNVLTFSPPAQVDEEALALYYAQSWGLFHYLYTQDRRALETLLTTYNKLPPLVKLSTRRQRQLFLDAIVPTDLPTFERRYLDFIKQLPPSSP